jgi:hypothetical protein
MRAGIGIKLAGALAALALVAPATASAAKTVTYGGTVAPKGAIAMDTKVNRFGFVKKIIALRGAGIPSQCESSGQLNINVNLNQENTVIPGKGPFEIKVKRNGKFRFSFTDPQYNLTRSIKGKFSGRKDKRVGGEFKYAAHYPAEGYYPEENCDTGLLDYKATKGGTDVVPPQPTLARR